MKPLLILIITILFPINLMASAIWGTTSGDVTNNVKVEFYRTICGGVELKHTTYTASGGFYYYSFNETGEYTVIPSITGYTVAPDNQTVIIPNISTTIANVDFTTTLVSTDRFIDNNNGTITDSITGYVWLKNANCFGLKRYFVGAVESQNLDNGTCGLTDGSSQCDWRAPSWTQLQSLGTEDGTVWGWDVPSKPWIKPSAPFINVQDQYWTIHGMPNLFDARWIDATTGHIWVENKQVLKYHWPVKSE